MDDHEIEWTHYCDDCGEVCIHRADGQGGETVEHLCENPSDEGE